MGYKRALVAMTAVLSACGPTVVTTDTVAPPAAITPPSSTVVTSVESTSTVPTVTTTLPDPTTTTIPSTLEIGDWEGELIEFGPTNGARLLVVGVRYNDVLNVRDGPGADHGVITTLEPVSTQPLALGMTWLRPESAWYAIDIDGVQGWASAQFLSQRAGIFDVTATVVERMGEVPESGSLIELGMSIARAYASEDPPSTIEQPAGVIIGEVGEITIDVIGLGDDAVAGYRLRIVADDVDGRWVLSNVEATVLCSRGVAEDRCV